MTGRDWVTKSTSLCRGHCHVNENRVVLMTKKKRFDVINLQGVIWSWICVAEYTTVERNIRTLASDRAQFHPSLLGQNGCHFAEGIFKITFHE